MKHPIRALSAALLAAGIAVTAATPAGAAPPAPPTVPVSATPSGAGDSTHSVTLITGDVVTLRQGAAGNTATVLTAEGRPANARIIESNGDLFVYPEQTVPYVARGLLDEDLFNVTDLVADGYDDAHAAELPLIVTYPDAASSRRADAVPVGGRRHSTLSSIDGASVVEPRETSAQFWSGLTAGNDSSARKAAPTLAGGIAKIWLDGVVTPSMAESAAQIGAPEVWATGTTGEGVAVAVLDTGIDSTHPDFAGQLADVQSFVPGEDAADVIGHGTHVASTIAGTGAASGGTERGVASGAKLNVGKVIGNKGVGLDSWIIGGMEWAAREKRAKVINMSIGGDPTDGSDPMSMALDSLSAETGALFVVSAGNAAVPNTIASPASAASALTVGAVDAHDALALFSSEGPRLNDHVIKPEITAPGVGIIAAWSQLATPGTYYRSDDGTSMAAPHVAGVAALLLQKHPELTGAQVKDALVSTSKPTPAYTTSEAGNGRVDAVAATEATLIGPGAVSVDRNATDSHGVVSQPLTYTNLSASPVTVALSLPKSSGGPFALSASTLVVPARGQASVTLTTTIDNKTLTDTLGSIVATVGSTTVARTALSVAPRTFELKISVKDENGAPMVTDLELLEPDANGITLVPVEGTVVRRMVPGSYSAMVRGTVQGVHGPSSLGTAIVGIPDINLTKDTSVVIDLSKARQIETTVPQVTRDTVNRLEYYRSVGKNYVRSVNLGTYDRDSLWTVPTGKVTHGEFDLIARWRKEQPEFTLSAAKREYTDVARQLSTTRLAKGTSTTKLVFAGNGSADELAAATASGNAVVVRRNPSVIAESDQAAAAAAAGVKLLIVVNDRPGVPVIPFAEPLAVTPIEVVAVSPDEGAQLIAEAEKKNAKATFTSTPDSAYVYDVLQRHHNQTPQNLVVHEDARTLARVAEDFSRVATSPLEVEESRFDLQDYDVWGIATASTRPLASKRVDWVSVGDGWRWGQDVNMREGYSEQASRVQYLPGSLNAESWFAPIIRPYLNNSAPAQYRTRDVLAIAVPGFGGGAHTGDSWSQNRSQTVALYQGSALVDSGSGLSLYASGLPSATLPYRFVTKTQDAAPGALSSSTTTQWNFTSGAPASADGRAVPPMAQLLYGITANAKGVVKNESTVSITPQQLPGATGAGTLGKPTVALSYDDGKTWRSATVTKGPNGSWTVTVEALLRTKFVSIRTDLADSKGNSVSQTIIRAFGVN